MPPRKVNPTSRATTRSIRAAQPFSLNPTGTLLRRYLAQFAAAVDTSHQDAEAAGKAQLREDRRQAAAVNESWAMDFAHDQLSAGRKLRVLTIVDTLSRFSPALDARFSYRGEDVVATLDRVCGEVCYPKEIRVDQGSEFVSRDLDLWAYRHGVTLDFPGLASRPTMPTSKRSTVGSGRSP